MCTTTPRACIELPPTLAAPSIARTFVAAHTCREHSLASADDAVLLTSEAITNSVLYGAPPILLFVDCAETVSEIRVRDGGANQPGLRVPDVDDPHGRGLLLIDMLSEAWGVEPLSDGKELWFLLRPPASEPALTS